MSSRPPSHGEGCPGGRFDVALRDYLRAASVPPSFVLGAVAGKGGRWSSVVVDVLAGLRELRGLWLGSDVSGCPRCVWSLSAAEHVVAGDVLRLPREAMR